MSVESVYGGAFIARFDYIKQRHGSSGVDDLFASMRKSGYTGPMDPEHFKIADKYPVENMVHLLEVYLEIHGDTEFDKLCRAAPSRKGIVGFFVRWTPDTRTLFEMASQYWPKFYDFGSLEGSIESERSGILQGKGVSPKPIFCRSLHNYFMGILDGIKLRNVRGEHTKCQHRGDEICQWDLHWD